MTRFLIFTLPDDIKPHRAIVKKAASVMSTGGDLF